MLPSGLTSPETDALYHPQKGAAAGSPQLSIVRVVVGSSGLRVRQPRATHAKPPVKQSPASCLDVAVPQTGYPPVYRCAKGEGWPGRLLKSVQAADLLRLTAGRCSPRSELKVAIRLKAGRKYFVLYKSWQEWGAKWHLCSSKPNKGNGIAPHHFHWCRLVPDVTVGSLELSWISELDLSGAEGSGTPALESKA